ncbi:MAG TPA: zeta toxin family protein [Candidatus Bariatricus faecipullorum]|nr:zeta toxin family protein [Candidatus Bariatricus faecipullorum]
MLNSVKKPMVLVLAGPNGSGKSTVTQYFETVGTYTNADDVVAATGMSNEEAAKFVDNRRYESIRKREDFTFETVLSSHYKLDILNKAKAEGYFIKCVFILTVSPDINIARVRARVEAGGHDVERERIISRYDKSLGNIKKLLDICDIMHVYDNSLQEPVRIIRKHKEELSIFPNELWPAEKILKLLGVE